MTARPLLVVDHDGVVADTLDVYSLAVIEACQHAGISAVLTDADVLRLCDVDLAQGLREAGAGDAAVLEVERRAARALRNALPWMKLVPLMAQLLDELSDAFHVVVFSRYDEEIAAALLHRFRVTGVAEVVGLRPGEAKAEKLGQLLARFANQAECWHVTGTTGDVRAALRAGASPCGVAWGWHEPQDLLAAGAVCLAETPPELLEIVAPGLAAGFWD